ncbi:MAG TPA: aminotransferase class III-fold pyridoxal phosphate-dependent enzyme [Thermoanaerobaculia bacterium]|nr:aminotransferase class III-fold pyridoxal phosphate-dependent enzyme [Thermoanaerobaculia bacterium]
MNDLRDLAGAAVPHLTTELPGPRARALIEAEAPFVSPSLARVYPLVPERAAGLVIEDVDGNRFLDFNAGIAVNATGHGHPQVLAAIESQARRLVHYCSTDFHVPVYGELARRLAELAPFEGAKVFLANSGTEAVEAAVKLARWASRRPNVIAFFGAFHGRTLGSLALTASKARQRAGFGVLAPGVFHAPYAHQGELTGAAYLEQVLFTHLMEPSDVAAVVVEPIQGEGGYVVPPAGWLPELAELCRRHGILLVADEVQSGVGRTGKMWAVEHEGVVPDMIVTGKGLASGMPLAALVARGELMTWGPGRHGSTFGGNPVACAAALATLDLVERELAANAARVGEHLLGRLSELASREPRLLEVRGRGLMIGLELPSHDLAEAVERACFERGLLVLTCGQRAIRLAPPLVVSIDHADLAVEILAEVLAGL